MYVLTTGDDEAERPEAIFQTWEKAVEVLDPWKLKRLAEGMWELDGPGMARLYAIPVDPEAVTIPGRYALMEMEPGSHGTTMMRSCVRGSSTFGSYSEP